MKRIYPIILASLGLAIAGCASTSKTNKLETSHNPAQLTSKSLKNPISVTLYTGSQKPKKPYVVLGHETVSKYNVVGIKRQEANIKDSIRHLAATRGGDAVIEITNHPDSVSYTVISYQNNSADIIKTDKV